MQGLSSRASRVVPKGKGSSEGWYVSQFLVYEGLGGGEGGGVLRRSSEHEYILKFALDIV